MSSNLASLLDIRQRYFRTGHVRHHGDCRIYSDPEWEKTFCSCGLLHDLLPLSPSLVQIIYPSYEEDAYKQENQEDYSAITPAKLAEMRGAERVLEEVLGKPLSDVGPEPTSYGRLIEVVFGCDFPAALDKTVM